MVKVSKYLESKRISFLDLLDVVEDMQHEIQTLKFKYNMQVIDNENLNNYINDLYEENESRKAYQRVLENKICRLKDRIKVLEGNYGKGDKERLQAEGKVRKDNFDRRVKW